MKKKIYIVPVRSHVSADYRIEATSKDHAHRLVEAEMAASLKRQIENADPHPQISNMSGYTEAMKSMITIERDHEKGAE